MLRRSDGDRLSRFQRLGITLVILGLMQSLVPACFRPNLRSLRLAERVRVALTASLDCSELSGPCLGAQSLDPAESRPDQESDQESQDLEDLAECIAWPEALTERRSVERGVASATHCSLAEPGGAAQRTLLALQQSRVLIARALRSSNTITRLCRFTC